jgi:hypothetical protein
MFTTTIYQQIYLINNILFEFCVLSTAKGMILFMQNVIRCKACGFIMNEGSYDVCPACGVSKAAFEPYKLTISEKRKRLLDLHIHPILIHFPQAFTLFALVLLISVLLIKGTVGDALLATTRVIITLLPAAVLAGFFSGILDGKIRFKKIKAPFLKQKVFLGSAFIITSIISAIFIYFAKPSDFTWFIEILFMLVCTALSGLLGKIGASLIDSKLPG